MAGQYPDEYRDSENPAQRDVVRQVHNEWGTKDYGAAGGGKQRRRERKKGGHFARPMSQIGMNYA
jgi:hypothetical protein